MKSPPLSSEFHIEFHIQVIYKDHLRKFGPLLIPDFVVTRRDPNQSFNENLVYTQPEISKSEIGPNNGHAILLVDIRTDGPSRCFLLQNWWQDFQDFQFKIFNSRFSIHRDG
jgi:hypothetical protein